jgi:hypothetical protein
MTTAQNKNSSITRVRPVFQQLIRHDPSGETWISKLMEITGNDAELANNPGKILPELVQTRPYQDKVLKRFGIEQINLENCFEYSVAPPERFLRWLIMHPERMTWPQGRNGQFGAATQYKREALFGKLGIEEQSRVQEEALAELDRLGCTGSKRKWWAFEGFTEVDCFLETNQMLLLIEGKRTETLSGSTAWYPGRNQLLRNLETAQALAGEKSFAVIVATEELIEPISEVEIGSSLPHFSSVEREDLMKHYLGCVTWENICEATGLDFTQLPNTTAECEMCEIERE